MSKIKARAFFGNIAPLLPDILAQNFSQSRVHKMRDCMQAYNFIRMRGKSAFELPGGGRAGKFLVFLEFFLDRKSTRLNSSHQIISYAVFCLKKKIPRLEAIFG